MSTDPPIKSWLHTDNVIVYVVGSVIAGVLVAGTIGIAALLIGDSGDDGSGNGAGGTTTSTGDVDPEPPDKAEEDSDEATTTSTTSPTTSSTSSTTSRPIEGSSAVGACVEVPVLPVVAPGDAKVELDRDECPVLVADFITASSAKMVGYDLTAGQRVVVRVVTPGVRASFEMVEPGGATVFEDENVNTSETFAFTAGATGRYVGTFIAENDTGSYQIRMLQAS